MVVNLIIHWIINNFSEALCIATLLFGLPIAVGIFNDQQSDRQEREVIAFAILMFIASSVIGLSHNPLMVFISAMLLIVGWVLDGYYTILHRKNRPKRKLYDKRQAIYIKTHPELARKINRMTNNGLTRGDVKAVMSINLDKVVNDYRRHEKHRKESKK